MEILMRQFSDMVMTFVVLVLLLALGYCLGYLVAQLIRKVLMFDRIQSKAVSIGAASAAMWKSLVDFIAEYTLWVIVFFVLTAAPQASITKVFFGEFIAPLTAFLALVVAGLLVGGFFGKLVRDGLGAVGFEGGLASHRIATSIGGVPVLTLVATLVKWYSFLLVLSLYGNSLSEVMANLKANIWEVIVYLPHAILGLLVILAALVLGDFAASRIKAKGFSFSEFFAAGIEVVIIFFGVVLALPNLFGVNTPEIFAISLTVMTQSFQILLFGVALGLAAAMALGLKDSVSKMAGKFNP
jgi:hypothetical protein